MREDVAVPTALEPVYWVDGLHEPVTLYEGLIMFQPDGGDRVEMTGSVTYDFLPKARVRFSAGSSRPAQAGSMAMSDKVRIFLSGMAGSVSVPVLPTESAEGGGRLSVAGVLLEPLEWGDGHGLFELRFNVVNMKYYIGCHVISDEPHSERRDGIVLVGGEWEVTLNARKDVSGVTRDLRSRGGSAFTHVGRLRRTDGSSFDAVDAEEVLTALMHLLSFARGGLVGVVLPVGFDDRGRKVWHQWRSDVVDPWRGSFNWFPPHHAEALEILFAPFLERWQDHSWHGPLRDLVRFYVEADDPNLVEKAVVMSQAALDLLAWTVLVEEEGWSQTKAKRLGTTDRLRELLKWAGVPSEMPVPLSDLSGSKQDGPKTVIDARNHIIHPKGADSPGDLYVVWRMSQWYLELGLLRLLGYHGHYDSRLIEGGATGTVEQVPWAASPATGPAR